MNGTRPTIDDVKKDQLWADRKTGRLVRVTGYDAERVDLETVRAAGGGKRKARTSPRHPNFFKHYRRADEHEEFEAIARVAPEIGTVSTEPTLPLGPRTDYYLERIADTLGEIDKSLGVTNALLEQLVKK